MQVRSTRGVTARALGADIVYLLAYPAALAAWVGSALVVGQAGYSLTIGAALMIWPLVFLPGFASRDLVGFASLAWPSAVLGLLGIGILAMGGDPSPLLLAGAAWIVLWTIGGRRIWPWWSRTVLRRHRPGSPEARLLEAWRQITPRWRKIRTSADSAAIWNELLALRELETERTRPVITGIFALWDLAHTRSGQAFERANSRLNQEWDRLFEQPRVRVGLPGSRQQDVVERPTRATWLEYAYPAAESILAVATETQLRQIATASARRAVRGAGVATDRIELALDQAREGTTDVDLQAEIGRLAEAARRRRDELAQTSAGGGEHADIESATVEWRAAIAVDAVSEAIAADFTPIRAANAVSQAIRSENDGAAEARYIELIRAVVGPGAAMRATDIPTPFQRHGTVTAATDEAFPSVLGSAGSSVGGLTRLVLIAAAAGLVGTLVQQAAWQLVSGLSSAISIDGLLGVVLVAVIAHALVWMWLERPGFLDVVAFYIASGLSATLASPISDLTGVLTAPLGGDASSTLVLDSLALLGPVRAIAFALAMVIAALLLRQPGRKSNGATASIPS
jgi:hypothetical protein